MTDRRKNRNPKKSVHFLKYMFRSKPSLATVVQTKLVGSSGVSKEIKSISLHSRRLQVVGISRVSQSPIICARFNASVSYIKVYSPYRSDHNTVIPTTLYATQS